MAYILDYMGSIGELWMKNLNIQLIVVGGLLLLGYDKGRFIYSITNISNMPNERQTISIFEETYQKLLDIKLKLSAKEGREITWDELLLDALEGKKK